MSVKRVLATIVGLLQSAVGALALVLAGVLYFNFLDTQTMLSVSSELLPLSLLFLSVFGFFSVISGLFLFHEH